MAQNSGNLIKPTQNPNQLPPGSAMPDPMTAAGPMGMSAVPQMGQTGPQISPPTAPQSPLAGLQAPQPGQPAQQLATPDQVNELQTLLAQVQGQNGRLVANKLTSRNEMMSLKQTLFTKLFDIMQQAGVDPGNPDSVRSFLESLAQTEPDLLTIFEQAFTGLAQDQTAGANPADMGQAGPSAAPGQGQQPSPQDQTAGPPDLVSRFRNLQAMGGQQQSPTGP